MISLNCIKADTLDENILQYNNMSKDIMMPS